MKVHYYFKEPQHPITVNVIGVGGTGSLVLPRLARIDHALKLLDHPGLMVFAYDDDKVEAFNIGRQNFSDCDLGRNKALAIIEKCNLSFGLLWKAHQRQFKPTTKNMANITIICVDNAQFRVDYYKWLEENKRSEWSGRVLNCPQEIQGFSLSLSLMYELKIICNSDFSLGSDFLFFIADF